MKSNLAVELHAETSFTPESSVGVFEPETVLPCQFFSHSQEGVDGGERKLMSALLSDGIENYIAQATRSTGERGDAIDWVHTRDLSYVFSFDMVCEALGINSEYLRQGLKRYVAAILLQRSAGSGKAKEWKRIRRPRKR